MLKLEKLDRRHNGSTWFTHRAYVSGTADRVKKFLEIREWAWTTFGPSCELNLYPASAKANWAWRVDDESSFRKEYYIYLTEEARTHFALKWI